MSLNPFSAQGVNNFPAFEQAFKYGPLPPQTNSLAPPHTLLCSRAPPIDEPHPPGRPCPTAQGHACAAANVVT